MTDPSTTGTHESHRRTAGPYLAPVCCGTFFEFRHPFKVAGVLVGVVLIGALAASLAMAIGGGDKTTLSGDSPGVETTVAPAATQPSLQIVRLSPISVDCDSELAAFPCSALTDDDPANSWNAPEGGIGAEITFLFSPAVQITELFIFNHEDEERFLRNARIRGIEVIIDDLPQAIVTELDDTNDPQKIWIGSLATSSLTITITSNYPGQSYEGRESFWELALQEIAFFGRIAPDTVG